MKLAFIALPLLFAAGVAAGLTMADDVDRKPTAAYTEAGSQAKAQTQVRKTPRHKVKRLPKGDLRYCLDLRSNAAVIRCAETGRKR
jgi:hypothetical protein